MSNSNLSIHHSRVTNDNISSILCSAGAYVITHTPDNIHAERYVGSSKNLYQRRRGYCNNGIIYTDVYVTNDIDLAESLERVLMEIIKPAMNIHILPLSEKDKNQ